MIVDTLIKYFKYNNKEDYNQRVELLLYFIIKGKK